MSIMAAHRIPYCATASVAYPEDMVKKLQKAKETKGFRFLHIFAPCPTGWKTAPDTTIELARLAVQTNIFPLYEVENGLKYTLTKKIRKPKPIYDYIKMQGRFKHLTDDVIEFIQKQVDADYEVLMKKVEIYQ